MNDDLKRREEAKRDAHWSPAERWRVIQETIAWADAQAPVPRNSMARCLELQQKKLRDETSRSQHSYGLLGCTGDPEIARKVAEADQFGVLESP